MNLMPTPDEKRQLAAIWDKQAPVKKHTLDFTGLNFPSTKTEQVKDQSGPNPDKLADQLMQELGWPQWIRFYPKPAQVVVALSAWARSRGLPKGIMWMAPGTGRPFQSASPEAGLVILRGDWAPHRAAMLAAQEEVRERSQMLVLDETATGFRLARGGAREYFGLDPDAVILGSALAGGLDFAVLAGRDVPPPKPLKGPSSQALKVVAATFPQVFKADICEKLAGLGRALVIGLEYYGKAAGVEGQVGWEGPLTFPRLKGKRLWAFIELAKEEGLALTPMVLLDPVLDPKDASGLIWPRLARALARLRVLPEGEKAPLGWQEAGERIGCNMTDVTRNNVN